MTTSTRLVHRIIHREDLSGHLSNFGKKFASFFILLLFFIVSQYCRFGVLRSAMFLVGVDHYLQPESFD